MAPTPMPDSPIKIGFIGLNAKDSWAITAHLPYLKSSPKYKIVALLNSSEESARAAIESHGLSPETKAYGAPLDFAADPDIDMAVCSVRVDKHYPLLKPILESGKLKAVHCEWPLGRNLAEAQELAALAKSNGIKSVVGLQGRKGVLPKTIRAILESGKIGRLLSVTVTASAFNFGAEEMESMSFLNDIDLGGNMVTIHFAHMLDTLTESVGQIDSYGCILEVKRPETRLINKKFSYNPSDADADDKASNVVGTLSRTSHDQILLQGHLTSGALISIHMRGGQPFPGTPALVWQIYGEKGELRLTTQAPNIQFGGPGNELWHHDHASGESVQIELQRDQYDEKEFPWAARNPARIYDAFANGDVEGYADWEDAIKRHKLIEEMYKRSRERSAEQPAQYDK